MPQLGSDFAAKVDASINPNGLIDEGIYLATLTGEIKVWDGNTVTWAWPLTIEKEANGAEQAFGGRKIDHKTWLSDAALWRLKATFDAFGVPSSEDTDKLIGKQVRIKVIVKEDYRQEIDDETGLVKLVNDVREVLPAEGPTGIDEAAKERRLKAQAAAKEELANNPASAEGASDEPLF